MASYPRLAALTTGLTKATSDAVFANHVIPYLLDVWLDEYERATPVSDIVETRANGFNYLFDIRNERLIAAWGISRGKNSDTRPSSRMAGHPLGAGAHYHRGHAIAHTLGGATDINLVPQLGAVNVGPFRHLEREAVKPEHVGALYFSYWMYGGASGQRPTGVEQGLLVPGEPPDIRRHAN